MQFRKLYPLWIVFGVELSFILYLIFSHRGVIGHDAFQYFTLQYYFLNNAVGGGETAQWLPFVTHGTVANWWYGVQAGILQSAMLSFGRLNSIFLGWNFLPIYYLGIFFDHCVFLLGVVLLGRRYFKSDLSVLFVAITALGSTTPFTQIWFNLHFFFAFPLIFYFLHALFETGRWRYFLLAGNLFAVQSNGTLPYLAPLSALVVCVYASFYVLFFWDKAKREVAALLSNWRGAIVPLAVVLVSVYCLNGMLTSGTEEIANYNPGRALDGRNVSLESFLYYGTITTNFRWAELVSRVSPALDYSLYLGYLPLAFGLFAVTRKPNPAFLMVACTALFLLLVSSSTLLSSVLYFVWPGMQFFRHLGLVSTIVKMLLCFVAGFGFERAVTLSKNSHYQVRGTIRIAIILLVGLAGYFLIFSYRYDYAKALLFLSVSGLLPLDPRVFDEGYLPIQLFGASLWCFGAAAFFILWLSRRIDPKWIAISAIAFQALDVYSFKINLARVRTVPLSGAQYDISQLQAVPYSPNRAVIDYATHPRGRNVPQNTYTTGAVYSTQDLIMFTDVPSNIGRTDHWLLSLDDFLRTYFGDRIRDREHKPKAFTDYMPLTFPFDDSSAMKLAGITEDKIQFFSRGHFVATDQKISGMMASKAFSGDILLLSGSNEEELVPLQRNERLQLDYKVIQYDANNIKISVSGGNGGSWLFYADCWHPFWSATVNGKKVEVHKANLAYKAVQLEQGDNVVHFRFHSSRLTFFMGFIEWNAIIWVFLPFFLLWRESVANNRQVWEV